LREEKIIPLLLFVGSPSVSNTRCERLKFNLNGIPIEFECRSSFGLVTEKKEDEKWIPFCSVVVVVVVVVVTFAAVVGGVLNQKNIPNLNSILTLNLINCI
jgi:hypothetical protein